VTTPTFALLLVLLALVVWWALAQQPRPRERVPPVEGPCAVFRREQLPRLRDPACR